MIQVLKKIKTILRPLWSCFLWYRQEREFARFVSRLKLNQVETGSEEVLFIVQPWLLTPLPWYIISLSITFYMAGKKVIIIIDDTILGISKWEESYQKASILRIIKKLPAYICWQKLSETTVNKAIVKPVLLDMDKIVRKNKTIYYRGEVYPEIGGKFDKRFKSSLEEAVYRIDCLLNDICPSYIVLGGGGYGLSGLWMDVAKAKNIRTASVDSGKSILLLSTDGIAANLEDIPRAFNLLQADGMILDEAKAELFRRKNGTDRFGSQIASIGRSYCFSVVLPLNQSYDLSALERHRVFSSQTEWILETIKWVLDNTNETIAIRRHPIERIAIYQSNDDYRKNIAEMFGANDRVMFIDSGDDVNTYDLIEEAKVVVPYISTVGIEAAALGKVVVTEGSSCYADLGFVWSAHTREEYFSLLDKALKGELILTKKMKDDAWKCYYLAQCCNWHITMFTPQPVDFAVWVKADPNVLLRRPEVLEIEHAISNNKPLSIIAHEKKMISMMQIN